MYRAASLLPITLVLMTGGCAVGPDFQRPAAPAVRAYAAVSLPQQTASAPAVAGAAQSFIAGGEVHPRWWTAFGSPALDDLVACALQASPDLQAAAATLRAARENAAAQRGAFWPSADLQLDSTRQKIASPLASPAESGDARYTLHTAQATVAYVPDVFGGNRRQAEALVAAADVQRFQYEAVYTTLVANVVNTAIQEAAARAQIAATQALIRLAEDMLAVIRRQHALGQAGGADVVAQESALAAQRAALPALEKQLAQQRSQLAVLVGRLPADGIDQRFELASMSLPESLPVSLPARLVEQRPDVRAAEAQLHAASALVGVATAARLPELTLTANIGSAAMDIRQLFGSGTGFWSVGADLLQPVFRGGMLLHQQRAARAAYDEAMAQYRSTVLTAFKDVADALQAVTSDAQMLQASVAAQAAAQRTLDMARRRRESGAAAWPEVLLAEQQYQQATLDLVQAQAGRFASTVAVFQALGGDWWQQEAPAGEKD